MKNISSCTIGMHKWGDVEYDASSNSFFRTCQRCAVRIVLSNYEIEVSGEDATEVAEVSISLVESLNSRAISKDEIDSHQRMEDIKRLIHNNSRALQKLKEQQATFGPLHTPPHILLEIENREAEIENLRTELKEIETKFDH